MVNTKEGLIPDEKNLHCVKHIQELSLGQIQKSKVIFDDKLRNRVDMALEGDRAK